MTSTCISNVSPKNIVFIQYGDYRLAAKSFMEGGEETYNAQKYSVDIVEKLPQHFERVSVIALNVVTPYRETLPSGVDTYGIMLWSKNGHQNLMAIINRIRPTHIVLRTPYLPVIRWANKMGIEIFPILADSFKLSGVKNKFKNFLLKSALNHKNIKYVANHNITAAKNLVDIGVDPRKIIPWDWPSAYSPSEFAIRDKINDLKNIKLLYVGNVSEPKGVGDYIDAISLLKDSGVPANLSIVGNGQDLPKLKQKCEELGITDAVNFLGTVRHKDIIDIMRSHDVVVVPSRLDYPEGLPMVIYEGLCSRVPLILSTHPMFTGKFRNKQDVLFFDAGNASSLAAAIMTLIEDKELYSKLSENSESVWKSIQCPIKWGELLEHWLDAGGSEDSAAWLQSRAMSSS